MAKKNGMTREEASAFYENLQASMKNWMANNKGAKKGQAKVDPKKIAESIRQGLRITADFLSPSGYNLITNTKQ